MRLPLTATNPSSLMAAMAAMAAMAEMGAAVSGIPIVCR